MGIKRFFFCDSDMYEKFYGPSQDYLKEQLERAGLYPSVISDANIQRARGGSQSTAQLAVYLWKHFAREMKAHFLGFEYSGNWDKESIVCWYPEKCIKPLAVSFDTAETWVSVDKAKERVGVDDKSKKHALASAEAMRSAQRARDLIVRYANYPDDKLVCTIQSQLARVHEVRRRNNGDRRFLKLSKRLGLPVIDLVE